MSSVVSEPDPPKKKKSESAQQLAATEEAAQARFEKAMNELREGAYRFSSKVRGQTDIVLDELIDPAHINAPSRNQELIVKPSAPQRNLAAIDPTK